jgi:hypothetical protein
MPNGSWRTPLVGCPQLFIQYIYSYCPYLEAFPSNHNLRTCKAVVTRDPQMHMIFGTWNVRSMYRAGSLRAVAEEISKYKLDSAGVQVRWDGGGTEPAHKYRFFYGKRNENHELGTYIRESYQQTREQRLLVIGCHT